MGRAAGRTQRTRAYEGRKLGAMSEPSHEAGRLLGGDRPAAAEYDVQQRRASP